MDLRRQIFGLLASLMLLSGAAFADRSLRKSAILVEAYSTPRCAGLDCPPWPIPDDIDFCFRNGDDFYAGIYRPWGVPWATSGKKLAALQGKTVEIFISDEQISVMTSGIKLRLKRVHDDPLFRLRSCTHN